MRSAWGVDPTAEGVSVRGEIDLETAAEFEEHLLAALERATGPFEIDLSAVTFMDSAGVLALTRVAEAAGGSDILIQASPQVFTILHVAGLTDGGWPNVVVVPPEAGTPD